MGLIAIIQITMMSKCLKRKLFFVIIFLVVIVDQISKYFAVKLGSKIIGIIPSFLHITLAYNTGAAWSIFAGFNYVLGIFGLVFVLFIFLKRNNIVLVDSKTQILFGLLCGGVLGNVFDRFLRGKVIDFIDVDLGFYHWPIFNIADVAIFLSVLLYFIVAFCNKKDRV